MRKKKQNRDFTEAEENEKILQARQQLLDSAESERRGIEALRIQRDGVQERIDKLTEKGKHIDNDIQSRETRVEQLGKVEVELTDKKNDLAKSIEQYKGERAVLADSYRKEKERLAETQKRYKALRDYVDVANAKYEELVLEQETIRNTTDGLSKEYEKKRNVFDSLVAQTDEARTELEETIKRTESVETAGQNQLIALTKETEKRTGELAELKESH